MTDLVFSVVRDSDWPQLRAYANSLSRSGFSGTKVMLVDNITQSARQHLLRLGFILQDVMTEKGQRFVTHSRFQPAVSFLEAHPDEFRYVVWTDVHDVVFQTDPMVWLEKNMVPPFSLVGAGEGWLIRNEPFNDRWANATLDESEYLSLREHEVLCGGTLAGTLASVQAVLYLIHNTVCHHPHANDQAALNQVLRTDWRTHVTLIPRMRDGFAATWFPEKIMDPDRLIWRGTDAPTFDISDVTVRTPETNTPFCIVHQYNRCPIWKALTERKYA